MKEEATGGFHNRIVILDADIGIRIRTTIISILITYLAKILPVKILYMKIAPDLIPFWNKFPAGNI